ncbi:5' nucleotidase, NT5C type [Alkalicoccus saliphilus]|jgi:uncharacterized protein|uniref:Nucleotidase n=1 Tax=Alkalicoccus saliphilus TaxID=200989 RepID=A0A2T4UAU3_9BACI|nr:hypothetical protein [Alkalicoccus saliphilus]PTL40517.1 hypothetical protein C6Y45_01020 [Alkalicoccus saliphilus]
MKKYRFGIDIDGTVTDPATFIPHLNKHFNKNLTLDDIVEYDLTKALGVTEEEFWQWMQKHEPMLYSSSTIADNAKDILHTWRSQFELFYISARPNHLLDVTEDWFHRQEVPYDHIELLGQHDKIAAVKKHEVDTFFEDKHDNAVNIAEEFQIPVVLMETPYNQMPVPDNVYRAKNWLHARTIVENIFQPVKK